MPVKLCFVGMANETAFNFVNLHLYSKICSKAYSRDKRTVVLIQV